MGWKSQFLSLVLGFLALFLQFPLLLRVFQGTFDRQKSDDLADF
jgi:hypothetical protein